MVGEGRKSNWAAVILPDLGMIFKTAGMDGGDKYQSCVDAAQNGCKQQREGRCSLLSLSLRAFETRQRYSCPGTAAALEAALLQVGGWIRPLQRHLQLQLLQFSNLVQLAAQRPYSLL